MDGYEDYKVRAQNELDSFRDYIRKHGEEYGFHANNKKRSFAKTEKIDIGDKSIQGVSDELGCRIDKLIRLTEAYRRESQ